MTPGPVSDAYQGGPSIEDAVTLQRLHDLGYTHLVWLDGNGFVIAHTDIERASGMSLLTCPVHRWLLSGEMYADACEQHSSGEWYLVDFDPDVKVFLTHPWRQPLAVGMFQCPNCYGPSDGPGWCMSCLRGHQPPS
jgi:hypothetical protein